MKRRRLYNWYFEGNPGADCALGVYYENGVLHFWDWGGERDHALPGKVIPGEGEDFIFEADGLGRIVFNQYTRESFKKNIPLSAWILEQFTNEIEFHEYYVYMLLPALKLCQLDGSDV